MTISSSSSSNSLNNGSSSSSSSSRSSSNSKSNSNSFTAVLKCHGKTLLLELESNPSKHHLFNKPLYIDLIESTFQLSKGSYYITKYGKLVKNNDLFSPGTICSGDAFEIHVRLVGGIDFQHREGMFMCLCM